jgi:hypothetical protein
MREICTSGSVREPAGNRWLYSAMIIGLRALGVMAFFAARACRIFSRADDLAVGVAEIAGERGEGQGEQEVKQLCGDSHGW